MFGTLQGKLIIAAIGMIFAVSLGFGICEQFVVKPLKAERDTLKSDISRQSETIQTLQDQVTMTTVTADKRAANCQVTINRMKAICNRPQPQTPTQEGGTSTNETPILTGSTLDLLNSMFDAR